MKAIRSRMKGWSTTLRDGSGDPRIFQIGALGALLAFGVSARAFAVTPVDVAAIAAAALATQYAGCFLFATRFEAKSALITTLSLSLLLRADGLAPLISAAIIAVGSKFALRTPRKHVFNPANIGIVSVLLLSSEPLALFPGAAWTTPGQWGTAIWLAALIAGVGVFVTNRAARLDTPLIFLGVYAALIVGRAIWLGDPLSIPLLRLQNGALILFAFFMISDPKTTPDAPALRAGFAGLVAVLAYTLTYHAHEPDGLFYALAIACIARPLFDAFDREPLYQWGARPPARGAAERKRDLARAGREFEPTSTTLHPAE